MNSFKEDIGKALAAGKKEKMITPQLFDSAVNVIIDFCNERDCDNCERVMMCAYQFCQNQINGKRELKGSLFLYSNIYILYKTDC